VDLAANDATLLSNTYALEKHYGWKGLCIEPNPDYFYNLSHYRENCDLVAAVVGRARMEQVYFYEAGDHSGILGFDNPERFKERSKQEYTITLLEIFEKFGVPKVIDYLSLDVEGAEDFLLRVFPLENYEIRLMTIERPKKELQVFLESKGYKQIQKLSRWGETLWAHEGAKLDTSHLDDFNAQKQHLAAKALEAREKKSNL
jgi:FkbM family methyltransferase